MKVIPIEVFQEPRGAGYHLLPLRFTRIPDIPGEVLITSEAGEYLFLRGQDFKDLVSHRLTGQEPFYEDLIARHFLYEEGADPHIEAMAAQYRTRKSYLRGGPALHLFVVTLRCDHSCLYCQVSRQSVARHEFDMSEETARYAIDRMFESPSDTLTVEFQGGEPLLAFDRIQFIIERVLERNVSERRNVQFVVTTTLHLLTEEMLDYFRTRGVHLSTSLDGPEELHNSNRPNRNKDSFRRTLEGLERARAALGMDAVAALTTLTRKSLTYPREIVDTYIEQDFRSIFLRPLSLYGFAVKTRGTIGYSVEEFLSFYRTALDYIIALNKAGTMIEEAYVCLLLNNILTPFPTHYVDLRSPSGAGLGALVYNYDGGVYASDESRMLAEMGNTRFRLGNVRMPYRNLMTSEAMQWLLAAGVAEALPGCADCAFLPYCGADPVDAVARQQDPFGHRPSSDFCKKQTGLFRILFEHLYERDPDTVGVFLGWLAKKPPRSVVRAGFAG